MLKIICHFIVQSNVECSYIWYGKQLLADCPNFCCFICYLSDDICAAAVSIPSISDIDTKLKLLLTHNLNK